MNAGIDGELVRKLRTAKSWSQEELGQISGLSERTIQRIETDGSGSLDSRRALASAFGLKPEDLLAAPVDAGVAQGDQWYVDRPQLGAGLRATLWIGLGVSVIAMLLAVTAMAQGFSTHSSGPRWVWLVGANVLWVSAYYLWVTANTTYLLSAEGLQVRYGPHRRYYRWDDFVTAYWRRGRLPVRFSLQPVTRFSDGVTLEPRGDGKALDLTPRDPEGFMRQITAVAPQLAHDPNR